MPEVRLVGEDGKQIGVIKTPEALRYAQERDLDLVEVAPEARPPVCRVLDYSKYKYEQAQKLKAARKHQQQITIREIKFRPKIAQNDYDTKKGHVARFLRGKDKVKITIMFRGREVTHPERGTALLDRLAGRGCPEVAVVEQTPLQDGRNMTEETDAGARRRRCWPASSTRSRDQDADRRPRRPRRRRPAANGDAAPAADAGTNGEAAPAPEADAPTSGDAPRSRAAQESEPAPASSSDAAA